MWWPERKPNEADERVEALVNERTAVLTWLDGSAKDASLGALDDLTFEANREARSKRFHALARWVGARKA